MTPRGGDGAELLRTEGLCAGYRDRPAVRDVTLQVGRGEVLALVGPNGAGKSTLIKCLAGVIEPVSGRVVVSPGVRVAYVPQQLPFDATIPLTVAEFLTLRLPEARRWWGAGRAARETAEHQLRDLGAAHLMDRRLGELSGGEFQRVLIASGLLRGPGVLLLDEPLTGVDVRGGMSFDALLHHMRDHLGLGVVMVSHDLSLVRHIAGRVVLLNGEVVAQGTPDEVMTPERLAQVFGAFHGVGVHGGPGGGAFIPLKEITGC
jgi:zinc transport system ATP-binding protein